MYVRLTLSAVKLGFSLTYMWCMVVVLMVWNDVARDAQTRGISSRLMVARR